MMGGLVDANPNVTMQSTLITNVGARIPKPAMQILQLQTATQPVRNHCSTKNLTHCG